MTKAGANNFHGDLMENFNDAILNANDFFNNASGTPRGRLVANQYAAALGGPIIKNKMVSFVNTEGLRYALPSSGVVSIPSPQFERYALAHALVASVPLYQDIFNNAPGVNRAVPVVNGTGLLQDGTGNLGCGHQKTLPDAYVSGSNGQQFGLQVPCALTFGTNTSSVNTETFVSGRIDHNISDKQRIYFRISDDWGMQASSTSPLSGAFKKQSYQPWLIPQINHTYVIMPQLVNNFVVSGNWYSVITGVPTFQKALALVPEGITLSDGGANLGGFASINPALPTSRRGQQSQVIDDLSMSWNHGRHTVQVWINDRANRVTDTSIASGSQVGAYNYNPYTLNYGYGNTSFDTRCNLTADLIWNSPRLRPRALEAAPGGWTVGAKLYLHSGRPFSATNSQIPGLLSTTFGGAVLADLLNPSLLGIHCTNVNARCFMPSQFAASSATAANPDVQTDFGNIQPNSFWGPGFFNISTQVTKTIPVREHTSFQIGASAFNLLNHPTPNSNVTSGSFGLITSTVSSPTSIYGTGQGAVVSGRVLVVLAKFNF